MSKCYCIKEYGYFASDKYTDKVTGPNILLPHKVFEKIEEFILKNSIKCEDNIENFMTVSYKSGVGKILKAKNYVGVININKNISIEILPKIYSDSIEKNYANTKKTFIKMLRYLKVFPVKKFKFNNVNFGKMNILDIFIYMFLQELDNIIKQGVKYSYKVCQENINTFKGKLLVNKNIIKNASNKSKFFMEYEEFTKNILENQIIKSTLIFLKKRCNDGSLVRLINQYLILFEEVSESYSPKDDIKKCNINRLMYHYDNILKWCNIFLNGMSFTNYNGKETSYSLLFPMEKIFEKYVGKYIKNSYLFKDYNVYTQHSKYYLLESHNKFKLKPDIVMEKKDSIIIMDTKWKILNNNNDNNFGISQNDLYQMYAYLKKYNSHKIILIYPKVNYMKDMHFYFEEKNELIVLFFDLDNMENDMQKVYEVLN